MRYFNQSFYFFRENWRESVLPLSVIEVGYSAWDKNRSVERPMGRNFLGIELVTGGDARFVINDKSQIVQAGSVFIKQLKQAHRYETGPSGKLFKRFLSLGGSALPILLKLLELQQINTLQLKNTRWFIDIHKRLIQLGKSRNPGWESDSSQLAYQLLLKLYEESTLNRIAEPIQLCQKLFSQQVEKQFNATDYANFSKTSITHLNRLFNQTFGLSLMAYFRKERLRYAASMLSDTEIRIHDISESLGFNLSFNFSTQFKKEFGISPSEFRRKNN